VRGELRRGGARATSALWVVGLLPLGLLAGLIGLLLWIGPAGLARREGLPPVERLRFQRVTLGPEGIVATVLNDGPDPVTIAQVQVDEAYWAFSASGPRTLRHLERTTLVIPYPWVKGEAHLLRLVTATGTTFDYEIGVAVETPPLDWRHLGAFTLIGLYVGVIPVAIGLLWFPLVRRASPSRLDFLLALTIGLLVFLLVDASRDGLAVAAALPDSFQGPTLFACVALAAYLALEALGAWLRTGRQRAEAGDGGGGWALALLVAVGIGLHNFGEGLAIGAAFALGQAALGTLLIIGFTLHNTTEGLAIVAPLARARAGVRELVVLGAIGGAPTIAGAWLGGLVYSAVWSVIFLAVGAGAIAQVVGQIARQMAGEVPIARAFAARPTLAGLIAGFFVMYLTGMLVG
jgi:ZIP family zinc transporter